MTLGRSTATRDGGGEVGGGDVFGIRLVDHNQYVLGHVVDEVGDGFGGEVGTGGVVGVADEHDSRVVA